MKSFPSTFNKGGNSAVSRGKNKPEYIASAATNIEALDNIQSKNLGFNLPVMNYLFSATNLTEYNRHMKISQRVKSNQRNSNIPQPIIENPEFFPSYILHSMMTYNWIFDNVNKVYNRSSLEGKGDNKYVNINYAEVTVSPAMFNPQYNVQTIGFTKNIPLLLNVIPTGNKRYKIERDEDMVDCSIERLVKDSMKLNSSLGQAKYRLVDFLYCKDLGKVSNNHLITLRKFPFPVEDHIFENTSYEYQSSNKKSYDTPGDIARMVTWFGTDDNKLEDICKYKVQYTWKELKSEIKDIYTDKENSENRGIVGKLVNALGSDKYANYSEKTGDGGNDIITYSLGRVFNFKNMTISNNDNNDYWRYFDNNKVWTPLNTIWNNHIPEGQLILEQEFTINFSYKLRAYENINPRAAMLDLIGNILECTYERGKFWGGQRRMIGPPHDSTGWNKAYNMINGAWDKVGSFASGLANGTTDLSSLLGAVSNVISAGKEKLGEMVNQAKETVSNLIDGNYNEVAQTVAQGFQKLNKKTHLATFLKATVLNKLGRPAMYAMDSIVSGDNFGPWHLTIGNPYNPIMAIGNLIMTGATITHSGALGVDDFPTELKVSCTLKPARSRDIDGIGRYYTRGESSLYLTNSNQKFTDHYRFSATETSKKKDEKLYDEYLKNNKDYMDKIDSRDEKIRNEYDKVHQQKNASSGESNDTGENINDTGGEDNVSNKTAPVDTRQADNIANILNDNEYRNLENNYKNYQHGLTENLKDKDSEFYGNRSMCLNSYQKTRISLMNNYSAIKNILGKDQYA